MRARNAGALLVATVLAFVFASCAKPDTALPRDLFKGPGAAEVYELTGLAEVVTFEAKYSLAQDDEPCGTALAARKGKRQADRWTVPEGCENDGDTLTIVDGDKLYSCDGDTRACSLGRAVRGSDSAAFPEVLYIVSDGVAVEFSDAERRVIAGRDARCFEFEARDGMHGTVCLDGKTGVLLFEETVDGRDRWSMTAVSFTLSVDDSVFQPPDRWRVEKVD